MNDNIKLFKIYNSKYMKEKQKEKWFVLFATLILFCLWAWFTIMAVVSLLNIIEKCQWMETKGIITEMHSDTVLEWLDDANGNRRYHNVDVVDYYYRYTIEGKEYTGSMDNSRKIIKNKDFILLVNPDDYNISIPRNEIDIFHCVIYIISSLGMFIIFIFVRILNRRKNT